MTPELNELIEAARRVKMSDEEKQQQRISFAYGNTRMESKELMRETVRKETVRQETVRRETIRQETVRSAAEELQPR